MKTTIILAAVAALLPLTSHAQTPEPTEFQLQVAEAGADCLPMVAGLLGRDYAVAAMAITLAENGFDEEAALEAIADNDAIKWDGDIDRAATLCFNMKTKDLLSARAAE